MLAATDPSGSGEVVEEHRTVRPIGAERWVAHRAASASGSGRATTSGTPRAIAAGIRDCVNAVAEEVTAGQVVPFLRKVIASP